MPDGVCRERQAIGGAVELIRGGIADVMLAGGTDSMIPPARVHRIHPLGGDVDRNDDPATEAGHLTATATASCLAKVAELWFWRSWSMPRPEERPSMVSSRAIAQQPMPSV